MGPLYASLLTREGATAERWVLFVHGILGSGANWRTFAKRWVDAREGWGAALVDLRMHGQSQDFEPPHTVQAAAQDLVELARTLGAPVEAIVGHSFGGKVALAYVDRVHGAIERAVILDSTPGTRLDHRGSETTLQVLAFLEQVGPQPSRNAFITAAVAFGIERGTAMWLAMNLVERQGQFVARLDLQAIHALLEDYFRLDLWEVLERPPGRVRFDLVLGGRSKVFSPEERQKLERLAARLPDRIHVTELADAGHWVHVDDPEGTSRVLLER